MRKEIINEASEYIRDNNLTDIDKVLEAFAEDNLTDEEIDEIDNLIFEYEDELDNNKTRINIDCILGIDGDIYARTNGGELDFD